MAKKLSSRANQVQQDAQALIEAGANEMFDPADDMEPLVSDLTAKWVAATLLSRAFNLEIPTKSLNGVHFRTCIHMRHMDCLMPLCTCVLETASLMKATIHRSDYFSEHRALTHNV